MSDAVLTDREKWLMHVAFGQAIAQAGVPKEKQRLDTRVFRCPDCNGPALNTMWGSVDGLCGSSYLPDPEDWVCAEPCTAKDRTHD